jgi:hypothetical protein
LLVAGASVPTYTAPSGISGIGSANNLAGGAALQIPYQSATNVTSFSPAATVGSTSNPGFLAYNGTGFVWNQWKTFLTNTNINTALGYTAADAAGTNASGTWPISISGNAATATRASTLGSGGGSAPITFTYNGNSANPAYVWGTMGGSLSQNELYTTGSLSVNYANSAGSAGSINSSGGLQNMTAEVFGSLANVLIYGTVVYPNTNVSGSLLRAYDSNSYSACCPPLHPLQGTWRVLSIFQQSALCVRVA